MHKLDFFCAASTGGGPVAVMNLEDARAWNGGWGDYFRVLGEHVGGPIQCFRLASRRAGFLFHEVDDGDYLVYCDMDNILILSEGYVPSESQSLQRELPDFEPYIVHSDPLNLTTFHQQVVIFDSVYPGKLISLPGTGFQRIELNEEPKYAEKPLGAPNAVLLEVNPGSWGALSVHRLDESYSFDGALFRRLSP
jgi:hypothetical protein